MGIGNVHSPAKYNHIGKGPTQRQDAGQWTWAGKAHPTHDMADTRDGMATISRHDDMDMKIGVESMKKVSISYTKEEGQAKDSKVHTMEHDRYVEYTDTAQSTVRRMDNYSKDNATPAGC